MAKAKHPFVKSFGGDLVISKRKGLKGGYTHIVRTKRLKSKKIIKI